LFANGNVELFSKKSKCVMVCNTWWWGTWTRFGGSSVEHISITKRSIDGVCHTTIGGIETFNHTIQHVELLMIGLIITKVALITSKIYYNLWSMDFASNV